jgi:hypothetical protein
MIEMRHRVDDANDAINESGAAAAGSITKFKLLAQQWEQLTPEDKVAELETYRKALKQIGIEITDINDADNVFINNSERVIKALIARARAAGAEKLIADAEELCSEVLNTPPGAILRLPSKMVSPLPALEMNVKRPFSATLKSFTVRDLPPAVFVISSPFIKERESPWKV